MSTKVIFQNCRLSNPGLEKKAGFDKPGEFFPGVIQTKNWSL